MTHAASPESFSDRGRPIPSSSLLPTSPTPTLSDIHHRTSGLTVSYVIWHRELICFIRQPTRLAAAIGTPAMIWALMGSGFARSFAPPSIASSAADAAPSARYALYLLPGMMTLVAMFTAIFSSISIIDDRRDGWMQSVLVSPAPRWSIAAGKISGGATLAFIQAALLLFAIPFLSSGPAPSFSSILTALAALAFTCIGMTGVGTAFAWISQTTQGFHAVMNLVLMPMWLLSGAFFPPEGAATWLALLMRINPLTWCHLALRQSLLGSGSPWGLPVSALFALAATAAATFVISRPGTAGRW